MSSCTVLVIGSANADIVIETDRLPNAGETISTSNHSTGLMIPGGKGANQAVAVSQLSPPSSIVKFQCNFGSDENAKTIATALTDCRVDLSLAETLDNTPSGQAFVFLQPNGQNAILIVGGANQIWPEQLTDQTRQAISQAKVVMLQREIPERINLQVARCANAAGVSVFLDAGGEDSPIAKELLENVSFFCPNETELARLSGCPVNTIEEAIAAGKHLQKHQGATNLLITLGLMGSIVLMTDGAIFKQDAFMVQQVIDTTGAGDTFRGAFAAAFANNQSVEECLAFASAASSLAIQVKGAIPSIPKLEKVMSFLQTVRK